jgi:hypothetical protein
MSNNSDLELSDVSSDSSDSSADKYDYDYYSDSSSDTCSESSSIDGEFNYSCRKNIEYEFIVDEYAEDCDLLTLYKNGVCFSTCDDSLGHEKSFDSGDWKIVNSVLYLRFNKGEYVEYPFKMYNDIITSACDYRISSKFTYHRFFLLEKPFKGKCLLVDYNTRKKIPRLYIEKETLSIIKGKRMVYFLFVENSYDKHLKELAPIFYEEATLHPYPLTKAYYHLFYFFLTDFAIINATHKYICGYYNGMYFMIDKKKIVFYVKIQGGYRLFSFPKSCPKRLQEVCSIVRPYANILNEKKKNLITQLILDVMITLS